MNEYENYEDILQGDFKENDPNSNILKTLMGWKWLTENCDSSNINNSAKNTSSILIVKTTDNVFIETFHLFDFVQAVLNKSPNNETLICDVVSHGSIARRPEGTVSFFLVCFLIFKIVIFANDDFFLKKCKQRDKFCKQLYVYWVQTG